LRVRRLAELAPFSVGCQTSYPKASVHR